MRLTRYHLFLLGGLFLMIMGPLAFTQPGPSGTGGKGGNKGPNSDFIFMMMSGGNDTFEVSKVQLRERPGSTVEQQREQLLTFLQKKGVTNGVMTKELYAEHFESRMTEMRAKWDQNKQGGPGATPTVPGAAPSAPAQDPEAMARDMFARMDLDKNGSLTVEELRSAGKMGGRLADPVELAKWDTNKNGTIELPEYIEYFKNRAAQRGPGGRGPNPPAVVEPIKPVEEEKRPVVYRTGKMPKELPPWFEEADKDKDGQVGLYEWKALGKPVREFMAMDQNGDGFITAEEVLRFQRATVKVTDTPSVGSPSVGASGTGGSTPAATGTPDSPRGKGKGKGGNNGTGGKGKGNRPPQGWLIRFTR